MHLRKYIKYMSKKFFTLLNILPKFCTVLIFAQQFLLASNNFIIIKKTYQKNNIIMKAIEYIIM